MSERPEEIGEEPERGYNEQEEQEAYEREQQGGQPDPEPESEEDRSDGAVTESRGS